MQIQKKKDARVRARVLTDYQNACPHEPPCRSGAACRHRHDIEAAIREGTISVAEGRRLAALYGVSLDGDV